MAYNFSMFSLTRHKALLLAAVILLIVSIGVFVPVLWHDFVYYDDNQYITENDVVQGGLTWEGVQWSFTTFAASNWHPLTWLSHMADVEVWGMRAGGHHLSNVLLHGLNTVLVFLVFHRMTSAMWRSVLAAALFAVHPLHVESVAWVSERKDVLSTCFGLLALWWYVGYTRVPTLWQYMLVVMWFGMSLMSKPMLVTLPFVLLLLDVWPLGRVRMSSRSGWRRVLVEKVPLLIMAAGSSIMTMWAQQTAVASLETVPLTQRMANATLAYGMYLWKTIWPTDLAVIYPLPLHPSTGLIAIAALFIMTFTAIAFIVRRRAPQVLIGWLIFLGTLVPVIGIVQVGEQVMADRYMYFPLLGLIVLAVWSIPVWDRRTAMQRPVALIAIAVMLVMLAVRTFDQCMVWRNTHTLFSHAAAVTTANHVAANALGYHYHQKGDHVRAASHYERAVAYRPNFALAHANLGHLRFDQRDFARAASHYHDALRARPNDPAVWNNLAVTQLQQGQIKEAEQSLRRAIEQRPQFADALENLSAVLVSMQRYQEAAERAQSALEIKPDLPIAHSSLGAALWNLGQKDEAITHYSRALELNPGLIQARINLAVALASRNQLIDAIAHLQTVLRAHPNHPVAQPLVESLRAQMARPAAQP